LSSEQRQIDIFKNKFRTSEEPEIQMMILDALMAYDKKGIETITDLINDGIDVKEEVKTHGLRLVNSLKDITKRY
jgi:hypothetical protein